jgi:hypothetical protein
MAMHSSEDVGKGMIMATDEEVAQCVADFMASGDSEACGMCACEMCITELANCTGDTAASPNPTVTQTSGEVCQEILQCTGAANCMGDACWCGCTTDGCCSMGTNYTLTGPCKEVINKGASMVDYAMSTGGMYYPVDADEIPGPGKPIGNANEVGACLTSKCGSVCQ